MKWSRFNVKVFCKYHNNQSLNVNNVRIKYRHGKLGQIKSLCLNRKYVNETQ